MGIAGLARLFRLLLPNLEWPAALLACAALLMLVANVCFVLRPGLGDFVHRLTRGEEGPYAAWSACTLCLLSSFSNADVASSIWICAVVLGLSFAALGVRDLWRTRRSLDPAHLSWFAWLVVAANTVPPAFATRWPDLDVIMGGSGYAAGLAVLVACLERVARTRSFRDARSPWFAPGGASALAMWAAAQFDGRSEAIMLALPVALGIAWLAPIVRLGWLRPNLFPLCNLALGAWSLHWELLAWLLAMWGVVIAAIEMPRHLAQTWQRLRT